MNDMIVDPKQLNLYLQCHGLQCFSVARKKKNEHSRMNASLFHAFRRLKISLSLDNLDLDLENSPTIKGLAVWLALCLHSHFKVSFSIEHLNLPEIFLFWGEEDFSGKDKHININKLPELSRVWVGGKYCFMCFFRVIPYGGEKHLNKNPKISREICRKDTQDGNFSVFWGYFYGIFGLFWGQILGVRNFGPARIFFGILRGNSGSGRLGAL